MALSTTNYKFVKPQRSDAADIEATNSNWDSLDTKLKDIETNISVAQSNIGGINDSIDALNSTSTDLQSGLDDKQAKITGAATTITNSNLTANRALVSNANGKVGASAVTSIELGYVAGATSNIQTQLGNRVSTSGGTLTGMLTFNNTDAYHALHKYRVINNVNYGINVGCGILGGDGIVSLEVRQGNSTDSELLGRLEIGERGVSFLARDGKRTYLTNNGAALAVVE